MRNTFQLLRGGFQNFMENPGLFLGILAVPLVFSILAILFEPNRATGVIDTTEWVVYMIVALISAVFNILLGIALTLAADNRSLSVRGAYAAARPFFWRYLGMSILVGIILVIAFVLFIVPGVIVSVWLTFAAFVLVLENAGIVESMKKSREYVRGKWWAVFGRLAGLTLVALIALAVLLGIVTFIAQDKTTEDIIGTIVSLLLAPIMVNAMYLLYQDVKGGSFVPPPVAAAPGPVPGPTPAV